MSSSNTPLTTASFTSKGRYIGDDLLFGLLVVQLGPLEQFFEIHGSSPLISFLIFSIAW